MDDFTGLAKLAETELAKTIYSDGLQKTTTEAGQLLGEVSKTTRMVLQPLLTVLQGASARIDEWISEAVNGIPPERLVEANVGLLRKTIQAIGSEDDQSSMRENYIKLLASMMDRDRQADVHPAYPGLLQELSPLDALLLQITQSGKEVPLPDGLEWPPYHFQGGLVAAWDTWKENGANVGQYRFFSQVAKKRSEALGKSSFSGKTDDHMGFLEYILPQETLFRDKGHAWQNLERLGLTHGPQNEGGQRQTKLRTVFHRDPVALTQLEGLSKNPEMIFGYRSHHRTQLGKAFATCCVPTFTGRSVWHPVSQT